MTHSAVYPLVNYSARGPVSGRAFSRPETLCGFLRSKLAAGNRVVGVGFSRGSGSLSPMSDTAAEVPALIPLAPPADRLAGIAAALGCVAHALVRRAEYDYDDPVHARAAAWSAHLIWADSTSPLLAAHRTAYAQGDTMGAAVEALLARLPVWLETLRAELSARLTGEYHPLRPDYAAMAARLAAAATALRTTPGMRPRLAFTPPSEAKRSDKPAAPARKPPRTTPRRNPTPASEVYELLRVESLARGVSLRKLCAGAGVPPDTAVNYCVKANLPYGRETPHLSRRAHKVGVAPLAGHTRRRRS